MNNRKELRNIVSSFDLFNLYWSVQTSNLSHDWAECKNVYKFINLDKTLLASETLYTQ